MQHRTSQAAEDYLKAIYTITRESGRASTHAISEEMGVSPASATGMIQKLASGDPPLLVYEKNRGAALTQAGEQVALEVIRHHRLLETFLQEKLGYTWDEVHEEADRLEHFISEELEDRIARSLGNPNYDPHGDPIPNREFKLPEQSSISLAQLHPGDQATIVRINTENPEILRYLASIGIELHSHVSVAAVSPFDENTSLKIDEKDGTFTLGTRLTDKIFVQIDTASIPDPVEDQAKAP